MRAQRRMLPPFYLLPRCLLGVALANAVLHWPPYIRCGEHECFSLYPAMQQATRTPPRSNRTICSQVCESASAPTPVESLCDGPASSLIFTTWYEHGF